ncbi:hypothetical protein NC653_007750, partial [Populus alba x Populus x berolinensis]
FLLILRTNNDNVHLLLLYVNQRVAKSVLNKDLYKEIDTAIGKVVKSYFVWGGGGGTMIKTKLSSMCRGIISVSHGPKYKLNREKKAIYIPHNRFQSEEAERKELVGLQKLYDKQQTLTAELSEKLQMTQKAEIERQNAMIKEKEHLDFSSSPIRKGHKKSFMGTNKKSLTKQALELREELEHAASEASNLFSKLELQDKLENGNKILVQKFQTQLAQQLDVLHLTVAASVTQQEEHLKSMEKDFNYSLSKKMGGIQELTTQVRHLKNTHESSIQSLDDISEELDMSYRSVFSNLTSEMSRNSSALVGLLEEKFQEINDILDDVQRDLFNQQEKLAEFAEQQRQVID